MPADIPVPNEQATASTFQQFAWDSFLGLNAAEIGGAPASVPAQKPLWNAWSSVVDMLSCQGSPTPAGCVCPDGDCAQAGSRFYPSACRAIPNYQDYRVMQQRGPVDDMFLLAEVGELSNSPVIDRFGDFLRYEIMVSPVTYNNIVGEGLWDQAVIDGLDEELVMQCGNAEYQGGDPAHPDMGNIVLKLAWMNANDALNLDQYYVEPMLVYTPGYRSSDGVERCELRTQALVGMHIAHKTLRQPNWIWSTFEHRDVAPNCTEAMTGPGITDTNMSCPQSVDSEFNLYGSQCNKDDPSCAPCNTGPSSNDAADLCRNPTTPGLEGWCLDQPPAPAAGTSKLCRHVAVEPPEIELVPAPIPNPLPDNYPQAAAWNQACANELVIGGHDPWSHYMLISSQWLVADALPPEPAPPDTLTCESIADEVFFGIVNAGAIEPKVQSRSGTERPFLGNITMESYTKSNCIGCHARAVLENGGGQEFTSDFMYFLSLNVAEHDNNFMTYMAEDPTSSCELPGDPAIVEFDLLGGASNSNVVAQSLEILVGIEVPDDLPAPVISARDLLDHSLPWTSSGDEVEMPADDSCTPGACEVDLVYAPRDGQTWHQYRSIPAVKVGPKEPQLGTHLVVEFEGLDCADIDPLDLRIWVSDNSQSTYANQVDGDYLDLTLFLLPEPPEPEPELELHAVPVLNRFGLLILGMGVVFVALRISARS